MKKNSTFTLIEVIVVLIALAILAAIAIPVYQNIVEQTKIDICTANQEALLEAVKIYDMKYDTMPSSLAKAWRKHGDEAFAVVWNRKKNERDYIYLAYISFQRFKYFLANIFSMNTLYAQSFSSTVPDIDILKCPSDSTPYDGGGVNYSYGINVFVVGMTWEEVCADASLDEVPIIGDSDTAVITADSVANIYSALASDRHESGGTDVAIYIDSDGDVEEEEEEEEKEEE